MIFWILGFGDFGIWGSGTRLWRPGEPRGAASPGNPGRAQARTAHRLLCYPDRTPKAEPNWGNKRTRREEPQEHEPHQPERSRGKNGPTKKRRATTRQNGCGKTLRPAALLFPWARPPCNPTWPTLQPYAARAATLRGPRCTPIWRRSARRRWRSTPMRSPLAATNCTAASRSGGSLGACGRRGC